MAEALDGASEEPLTPTICELARMVTKWEAGPRRPSGGYRMLYHRVFPLLGKADPPEGDAVYGGPGQPASPPLLPAGYARSLAAATQARVLIQRAQDLREQAGGIRVQSSDLRRQAGLPGAGIAEQLLAEAAVFPGIEGLARIAEEKLARGADPAVVRAAQETIRDLQQKAGDLAVVLASMTGEDEAQGDARAG